MLFDSALRKDLSRSLLATLTVLLTVVVTLMLIRTLGQASKGSVSPSDIMLVMAYTVLGYMPIVLSLSLFVAIIGTLARMYQDSEMVIWFASGLGLANILPTLARFAWPLIVAIAGLALFGWPWSQEQILDLRNQFQQRSDIDRIAPGEFQISSSGDSVFFVDRDSSSLEQAKQIFFARSKNEENSVTVSKEASLIQQDGQTWVQLESGQRVQQAYGAKPVIRVMEFERYETLLSRDPVASVQSTVRTMPSLELFEQRSDSANDSELAWRIGLVLAAINYVVLALALTSGNPRSGRMTHIITALLVFIVYFNLLSLGESWVGNGVVSGGAWLLILHGGVFALGMAWLWMRNAQLSVKDLWAKRGEARA